MARTGFVHQQYCLLVLPISGPVVLSIKALRGRLKTVFDFDNLQKLANCEGSWSLPLTISKIGSHDPLIFGNPIIDGSECCDHCNLQNEVRSEPKANWNRVSLADHIGHLSSGQFYLMWFMWQRKAGQGYIQGTSNKGIYCVVVFIIHVHAFWASRHAKCAVGKSHTVHHVETCACTPQYTLR